MRKKHQKFIGICFTFALLVLTSCHKESGEITQLEWEVINPVTGEGVSGVPVYLYEHREHIYYENSYHSSPSDQNIIWMDTTDENGKLRHTFYAKKNRNYYYAQGINGHEFDENGDIIQLKSENVYAQKDQYNHFEYWIIPKTEMVVHIKNFNCDSPYDEMKWRKKYTFANHNYYGQWETTKYGCVNEYSAIDSVHMDHIIVEIEVKKQNGDYYFLTDTSYINTKYMVDTLKVYY